MSVRVLVRCCFHDPRQEEPAHHEAGVARSDAYVAKGSVFEKFIPHAPFAANRRKHTHEHLVSESVRRLMGAMMNVGKDVDGISRS